MIENIRKYTGLMIVVLVLLFVGLVFLGDTARNSFSGKPVMEVNGIAISQKEFQRLAANALEIPNAIGNGRPLAQSSRKLASHYLGDQILDFPQVSSASILRDMTIMMQPGDLNRFLANRIAVREAGLKYGATPGPEEVEGFIENVLFADENGNFDQTAFSQFMEKRIGRLGIGSRGFNEYVRDMLTAQNLAKILGGGIVPETSASADLFKLEKQKITAEQITLDMLDFEADLKPTEEEIKAFYEENKEDYYSEPLRKAVYIFAEPDWDAALKAQEDEKAEAAKKAEEAKKQAEEAKKAAEAEKKAAEEKKAEEEKPEPTETEAPKTEEQPEPATETPDTPETTEEEGAQGDPGAQGEPAPPAPEKIETPATETETSDEPEKAVVVEEKPAAEPKAETPAKNPPVNKALPTPAKAPERSAKDKLSYQNKEKAIKGIANKIDDLYQALLDDNGNNFEDHASNAGFEVKTTELFSKSDPPKPLDQQTRDGSTGNLADAIFSRPADGDPDERLTDPYRTGEGWFIGQLVEVVEAVPLSFEEAKVRATVDLKKKLARDKMIAKAEELQEKLSAAVKDGKSFEEAAKEIDEKLKVNKLPNLTVPNIPFQYRAQFGAPSPPPAFSVAQYANPGSVADIKYTPNDESPEKALIVFVNKKEITEDDRYNSEMKDNLDRQKGFARYQAFQNWLYEQYKANEVVILRTDQP